MAMRFNKNSAGNKWTSGTYKIVLGFRASSQQQNETQKYVAPFSSELVKCEVYHCYEGERYIAQGNTLEQAKELVEKYYDNK